MLIRFDKCISQAGLVVCVCAGLLIHAKATEAQNSHPQTSGDRYQGCSVTKAADAFVPPSPYKDTTNAGSFFFGTAKLWTLVHPNSWAAQKLVWWSPGNDQNTGTPPGLTVTFRRLDAPAPPRTTDRAYWAFISGQPPFITTGITSPPTTGCWEITGRLAGEEVKYVVRLSTSSELQGGR
jgi:hypothetical protein